VKTFLPIIILFACSTYTQAAEQSTCFGTTKQGKLENGIQLPDRGDNFISYSKLGILLGRTYVHGKVHEVVVETYKSLAKDYPDKRFVYGETGFKQGGKFSPHKTHQNGLSVDFMVPVINNEGKSIDLPTSPLNKWGYSIEFDERGELENYKIDYGAIAVHLRALNRQAQKSGIAIWRVFFDPKLQKILFATKQGKGLDKILKFSPKPSWVRHDDHYHVDFKVKCEPLGKS
jgi:penicillin-insensitive murein endopeptidase